MIRKLIGAVFFASLVLLGTAPGNATTVYVTYTGTVASGIDTEGLFGTPGTDLTAADYTVNYAFDVVFGSPYISSSTASEEYVDGGTLYSVPSPALSASIEINSSSFAFPFASPYYSEIYGQNNGGSIGSYRAVSHAYTRLIFKISCNSIFTNSEGSSSGLPKTIASEFSYTVNSATDSSGGRF